MKVLLVTNDFPPRAGGIQQYLAGLIEGFVGEVRVLAPSDDGTSSNVFRDRRKFMWPTRRVRRWVEDHIAEFEPDLVLFGAPHPLAFLGSGIRRRTGVPFGVVCHGAEVTLPAAFPITRQLVAHPLRRADVLFAVSEFTARRVRRLTGRPVDVIGAGVNPGFRPGFGAADDGPIIIGSVSRFVPRKGQAQVLAACAALRSEGLDVSSLLVGRGRLERKLRRKAERLHVPTRFEVDVTFTDLPDLYRQMHVFVMPCWSRWFGLEVEGFGVVFLEAAATGLPVVAGDSGGAPETVDPGVTGFVVHDQRSLVDALRTLVVDPDLRQRMGSAGASRAGERFVWSTVSARFAAGVERVLERA
jgi:phosphatidylinositol alpha-1,6-mannosyltransferase